MAPRAFSGSCPEVALRAIIASGPSWEMSMDASRDVNEILVRVAEGSQDATRELYALLYDDLRRRARNYLRHERSNHTLQPTELVHEAYVRLVDATRPPWKNRSHFLAVASQVMRRILVDHARARARKKRGGGWQMVPLEAAFEVGSKADDPLHVLALDRAVEKLAQEQPEKARV